MGYAVKNIYRPYPSIYGMKWEKEFFNLQLKGTPYPGENVSYIDAVDPPLTVVFKRLFGIVFDYVAAAAVSDRMS